MKVEIFLLTIKIYLQPAVIVTPDRYPRLVLNLN